MRRLPRQGVTELSLTRTWVDIARERRDRFHSCGGYPVHSFLRVDGGYNEMTDLEAIQKVYELAIKHLKLPVADDQLDALFKVREMVMKESR
jgi:hypothetical protein